MRRLIEMCNSRLTTAVLVMVATVMYGAAPSAEVPAVRYAEGQLHGFLVLRNLEGTIIADGDLTQSTRGSQVTSRLAYHFKDGSLHEETSVFSQSGNFRLLTYHLVQKGPAFKRPLLDLSITASTGQVKVQYKDDDGKGKTIDSQMELPPDLANGMVPILLKNLPTGSQSTTASMLVATPKPMLVRLLIVRDGEESFSIGGTGHKATTYAIKVEIGGIKGVLAPIVGKQPPDTHIWMLGGSSPAFLKSEGQLYESGPIWRTELTSPVWHREMTESADRKK